MHYFVNRFVHIIAPVISGYAVAYYTYWLNKRNK
ncbi:MULTISPECIES: type I toxin-antitoxin system Fst family toxin [Staphylococcus]|nr:MULTISPECIES: type I toxin-antitoxin system Fst family toxin [Staphylococcus]HDA3361008.1 type I toxin-antitoxin system Fst family toxin [Staphylococcus aureus]MCC3712341.1 type I toxin-antitoxin system Fst family toxin [Staphylococcus hominis]MCH4484486.1 type I toxin-antitoxin system Fst family toxin [Staphylococcus haemolyticus]MCI2865722.1 type I toxin-antitoxin system Fst family toxin [Staphylococcus hominis]MCI2908941.1 type I toxin-antitoxin system Fst family toxin [Staphylococcus ho